MKSNMNLRRWRISSLVAVFAYSMLAERAVAVPVTNPSFEAVEVPSNGNPGDQSNGDDFVYAGTATNFQTGWVTDGVNSGYYTRKSGSSFANSIAATPDPTDDEPSGDEQVAVSNGGTHTQLLATTLAANTTYTLTVDLGQRNDVGFGGGDIRLGFGSNPSDLLTPDTTSAPTPTSGQWAVWQDVFTTGPIPAGLGQQLRIDLVSSGVQTSFDNVRLTAVTVPEPSSLALAGLAGVSIWFSGRRFRGRANKNKR